MDHLAHRVAGIFRHTHRVAAFFNLGDIVLYGKYKNKKGKVVAFGQNDKGQPTIEIEPIPKGRKKNKVLGLFKVWSQDRKDQALEKQKQEEKFKSAMADRVASRFLCSQFIGSLVVGAMDAKMEKLLNQLRKSAWGGVSSVKTTSAE